MSCSIVFTLINLTCGNSVAKHFDYKLLWHLNGDKLFGVGQVICPVFKVMSVSAFVMYPRFAVAQGFSFVFVCREFASGIVFDTCTKFGRSVFLQVVHKPTPNYSCLKCVAYYHVSVSCYCSEVTESVFKTHIKSPFSHKAGCELSQPDICL